MTQNYRPGFIHPAVAAKLPTMSTAVQHDQIVRISCKWCKRTHRYYPADLLALLGDVPFLYIETHFRCTDCGRREYMDAHLDMPSAQARVGMKVRRLVKIKTVRRPVWEDVTL